MAHPKAVGDRTTLAVMLGLQSAGCVVTVPFGENTRYDLVIEKEGQLSRVQCKTGRFRQGGVWFRPISTYRHHAKPLTPSRNYQGQIDYFGVHCPESGGVYLVPIGDTPNTSSVTLRVETARNGQRRRIRSATRYEIATVFVTPS